MTKPLYLIVACDASGGIGFQGELPWNIPEDWALFLEATRGGILIMGRVSYESMRRSEVFSSQDRTYIVVSRSMPPAAEPYVHVVKDVEAALALSMRLPGRVWGCGGVEIYKQLLPKSDFLVMTQIKESFQVDRYFPEDWRSYFPHRLQTVEGHGEQYRYDFNLFSAQNPTPGFFNLCELSLFQGNHE